MKRKSYLYIATTLLMFSITAPIVAQEQPKDSLAHYIKVAIEHNPLVKSQQLAYEATLQKVPQAGAFADPELSMGFYTKPMDIVGGRQIGDITVMQILPWFGTRKSARNEANHMAQMQYKEYKEAKENLALQVNTQWYILQKQQQQLANAEDNKKLLEQLEQLALKKFSSPTSSAKAPTPVVNRPAPTTTNSSANGMSSMGMGASNTASSTPTMTSNSGMSEMGSSQASGMSDVLRIRLEIIEVENTIETLQSQIKVEKAKFNVLLNREATAEVVVAKHIEKTPFMLTEDDVMAMIETNNPMLGMLTEQGLAYQAKAEMDKKMSYPMIGVGLQYMIIGKTNDAMLGMGNMNGKDMVMPMLTVSLPIFRKKYNAQQEESKLWWKSSEQNYNNTLNTLKAAYYDYKSQLEDTERIVKLYDKQSTLAETTFNLIVKEFVAGKNDLTNVIQVQRQLLDYQLKKAEAIANYNTMVASINKLIAITDTENNG